MECPVCSEKVSLSDEDINAPEAYYDCAACQSSLLFQKGKCQVLAEGAAHREPPADGGQAPEREPQPAPESQSEEQKAGPESGVSAALEPDAAGSSDQGASFDGGAELQSAEGQAAPEIHQTDQLFSGGAAGPPAAGGQPAEELDRGASAAGEADLADSGQPEGEFEQGDPASAGANGFSEENQPPLENNSLETDQPPAEGQPEAAGEELMPAAGQPPEEAAGSPAEGQPGDQLADPPEDQPAGPENQEEDFEFSSDGPAEPQSPAPDGGQKEDFSEVSKYGNTPSAGEDGIFFYDLFLSGIDSIELKEAVQMVLDDEYLKISPEEKDISIKNGALRVSKISPVKAHIIVKSLIGLPMGISWKQHLAVDQKTEGEKAEGEAGPPAAESKTQA